jgi:hypothetical protein
VSLLSLAEYALDADIGIGRLFQSEIPAGAGAHPGRMPLAARHCEWRSWPRRT